MEQALIALIGAFTALLGGDRLYQTVRQRRQNSNGAITKEDITSICTRLDGVSTKIETLNSRMERHLGYHEGIKE